MSDAPYMSQGCLSSADGLVCKPQSPDYTNTGKKTFVWAKDHLVSICLSEKQLLLMAGNQKTSALQRSAIGDRGSLLPDRN